MRNAGNPGLLLLLAFHHYVHAGYIPACRLRVHRPLGTFGGLPMKRLLHFFVCCALLLVLAAGAHATSYQIRELSLYPEGAAGLPCLGIANAIGSSDRIAGVIYEDGVPYAAVTNASGELVPLTSGFALGANGSGQAVGYAGTATKWEPDGASTALPLPIGTSFSLARAINDAGQIVGECWMGDSQVRNYVTLWNPGSDPMTLGEGCGNAVNSMGGIAGSTRDQSGAHRAFRWSVAGGMTQLAGGTASEGMALNDAGTVAGSIVDATGTWACIWNAAGALSLLQNLPGTLSSAATGINNAGAVVGTCNTAIGSYAVVWQSDGTVAALGELPQHTSSAAYGINDSGWVAGCSLDGSGSPHPVVWTPTVPEPAGVLALTMGLIGLVPLLRKR